MQSIFCLACLTFAPAQTPGAPQERVIESVISSLAYGGACFSTVELRNLSGRAVSAGIEAHRASGALIAMSGQEDINIQMRPHERVAFKLQVNGPAASAWVSVRETAPAAELRPVVALNGTTECVSGNELRSVGRDSVHAMRNPRFSGDSAGLPGVVLSVVNASEEPAVASVCYSSGNLYSVPLGVKPGADLVPLCSYSLDLQLAPFASAQVPVEREGSSHFSVRTRGGNVVLEMLRPVDASVRLYTVDSSIRFDGEIR